MQLLYSTLDVLYSSHGKYSTTCTFDPPTQSAINCLIAMDSYK